VYTLPFIFLLDRPLQCTALMLGSGQHLGTAMATGHIQHAWIVTWYAAPGHLTSCKGDGVKHAKPGTEAT